MSQRERFKDEHDRRGAVVELLAAGLVRVTSAHALTVVGDFGQSSGPPGASLDLSPDLPLSVPAGERSRANRETAGGRT